MAHKKGQGSTRNGRTSNPKYLGLKKNDGCVVKSGTILVRQRGTKINPGYFVGCGRDHTLFALKNGKVSYRKKGNNKKVYVSILDI